MKALTHIILFVCLLLFTPSLFSQVQLGSDIDGDDPYGHSGFAVSISSDGNRIAVGSPNSENPNIDPGGGAGKVKVYEWNSGTWDQIGSDIEGSSERLVSGFSVALSGDGQRLIVGAPRREISILAPPGKALVYEWVQGNWVKIGEIVGKELSDDAGFSVSISENGDIVAVGAPEGNYNMGYARMYKYNGVSWSQMGQDIGGGYRSNKTGISVSLSASGNRVAIGDPVGIGRLFGNVRVFEWRAWEWVQLGLDIRDDSVGEPSGYIVDISEDGNHVIIGSPLSDLGGNNTGKVGVFHWLNGKWDKVGNSLYGEISGDQFGYAVAISNEGKRIAIGGRYNNGGGSDAGHVRMFEWQGVTWVKVGKDIDGENPEDESGSSVDLSADGQRVIIGAPENGEASSRKGHARVYYIKNQFHDGITELGFGEGFKVYPIPSDKYVNVDLGTRQKNVEIRLINLLGQEMLRHKYPILQETSIPLPDSHTLYFLEIHIRNKGSKVIKVNKY